MRNRFFFIILTTLILAAVGINLIHIKFFQSQRLKLIDKQITESSKELLESEELKKAFSTPSKIDDVISKVLKGSRIGKAFILRDPNGKIIYESFNFRLLNAELPIQPEWVTVETDTEFVRVRNLTMPGPKPLVMQVSLVLDRNFINWEIVDSRVILYVTGVVLTLFIASVLLTLILLSPLRLLIEHLKGATSKLVNLLDVEPLPKRLAKYTRGFWAQSDEFSALLSTVQKLIDRINLNYKLTRSWTLQMAHELKTPLAIMRAETESNAKAELIPRSYSGSVIKEIQQMSDIISQFLEWAELENSQVQKDLHALRMKSFVKTVVSRLDKISPGRIQTELKNDFPVFANPIHLDQLISNLITNALKFSPSSQPVHLIVSEHSMFVKDHGPGVPKEVLERLGEPFNIGASDEGRSGNGLGLAWVVTVAKLYQWSFEIKSDTQGTAIRIDFPEPDEP